MWYIFGILVMFVLLQYGYKESKVNVILGSLIWPLSLCILILSWIDYLDE